MFDEDGAAVNVDSTVFMYLLWYKGTHYMAELVEVTADTAYFQVDASLVRKGDLPEESLGPSVVRRDGDPIVSCSSRSVAGAVTRKAVAHRDKIGADKKTARFYMCVLRPSLADSFVLNA